MPRGRLMRQRLAAVLLFALLFFYSPIVRLVESAPAILGVPPLYLYLYGGWVLVILAAALVVSWRRD